MSDYPTTLRRLIAALIVLLFSVTVNAAPQQVAFTVGGDNLFTTSDGQVIMGTDTPALGLLGTYADANFLCFGRGDGALGSPGPNGFFAINRNTDGVDTRIDTFALDDVIGPAAGQTGFGSATSNFGAPWTPNLADGNHYLGFLTTTGNFGWMQINVDTNGTAGTITDDVITIVDSYVEALVGVPILAGRTTQIPPNLVAVNFQAGGDSIISSADSTGVMTATPNTYGTLGIYVDGNFLMIGDGDNSQTAAQSGVFGNVHGSEDAQQTARSYSSGTTVNYLVGNLNYKSLTTDQGGVFPNLPDGNHFIVFRTNTDNLGWMEVNIDSNGGTPTITDDTHTILQAYVETTVGLPIEVGSTGAGPEIDVVGNGQSIADGDTTPALADDTDFGATNIATSISKTYSVNNTGGTDLTVQPVSLSGAGAGDYTVTANLGVGQLIGAGNSATFTVQFTPSSVANDITATVSIANDDGDENPYNFDIQGDGTAPPAPEINLQGNGANIANNDLAPDVADDTDFGTNGLGIADTHTFTIQNVGGVNLTVTSVVAGGDYAISGITPPLVIAAAGSATFDVTWTSTVLGASTQDIVIANDDGDENPYTFRVGGNAVPAVNEINLTGNGQNISSGDTTPDVADDTDFGLTTNGTNPTATFTIENVGFATLNITSVSRTSGSTDYSVTAGGGATAIAPGGNSTFTITYSAATFSATTAQISIVNDDGDENPYTFTVGGTGQPAGPLVQASGNGVIIADGDVTPDAADHTSFGTVAVGGSFGRTYTITNTGDATLTVSGITMGGGGAASFGVTGIALPSTIGIGATDTFQVNFSPSGIGTTTASVNIASDDTTSPYVYSVSGIGVNIFDADSGGGGAADDATGDAFSITRVGGNLEIRVNGALVSTVADTEPIVINGSSDDDTLTLDLAGGVMPDITYNGSGGTDSLVLLNADGQLMTYTPTNTTDGTLDIDGNTLTFTGLSPITHGGTIADVVIDTTAPGAQTIDIDATATDTTVDANGGFELITFANATNSLSINAGDGDDIISINTFAASTPTVNIDAQDGDDTINMPYSVTAGGLTFTIAGSSHTAGDLLNFDPEGNAFTDTGTQITGTPSTINYNTIETVNTVGEIDVLGNSNSIADGDATPDVVDDTDMGNATVGLTNSTRTYTISNTGAASINVTIPVVITGANSAEFSVTSQPSALVLPGGSTTFDVTFTPSNSGTFTAEVEITNDDADEGLYNFAIEADGDPAPSTIPTLSEWGMIILCLLMGSFGLAYMRRESMVMAGGPSSAPSGPLMPFAPALFKKCLLIFAGITIAGFAASIAYMGYVQMSDIIGGPICAAVAAYFTHLVVLMKREE